MAKFRGPLLVLFIGSVGLIWAGPPLAAAPRQAQEREKPSVVVIVTDDQRWDTLANMAAVDRHLVDHGMQFDNTFVVNPLCCPSRASILTGLYSHSTNVYRQAPPYGRFDWFDDSATIATWLARESYTTGLFGKYIDGYQHAALTGYVPPGWDRWVAFVHAAYHEYKLTLDGKVRSYGTAPSDYSTDVLAEEANDFIRRTDGPLLVLFAPVAPHEPATPALRDVDVAAPTPAPPANYDEANVSDKPSWVRNLPRLSDTRRAYISNLQAEQLRSLLAVDQAVERLVGALKETGRLSNTLVVYTSDNGLAWGEHRWWKKEVPYEESIRVPMIVRYDPAIEQPGSTEALALNIDIAPTIAEVTGLATPPQDIEGRSLVPVLSGKRDRIRRSFLIEHLEGVNHVPTYCAVRTERYKYVSYRTGERELYDLERDPFELDNLHGGGEVSTHLVERLDTRLRSLCDPAPPDVPPLPRVTQGLRIGSVVGRLCAAAVAAVGGVLGPTAYEAT